MDKADFTRLLKDPEQLEAYSYEDLEQCVLESPYCLTLRTLLLYKYQKDQRLSAQKHLELAAVYAPNLQSLQVFLQK